MAGLLVAGDRVAAWAVARSVVAGVTTAARTQGHTVEGASLTFHGFPFLTQLAGGSVDHVTGSVERASLGGHEVRDVSVEAWDVAARAPWRTDRAQISGIVTFDTLGEALGDQLGAEVVVEPAPDQPGAVQLSAGALGVGIGAVVTPTVRDASTVGAQVSAVSLAGVTVDARDLPGGLGDRIGRLALPLDLPEGVALESVRVEPGGLRVVLLAHDVALSQLAS